MGFYVGSVQVMHALYIENKYKNHTYVFRMMSVVDKIIKKEDGHEKLLKAVKNHQCFLLKCFTRIMIGRVQQITVKDFGTAYI